MITLLLAIILVSASTTIILLYLKHHKYSFTRDKASLLTIFFSGWLISGVFFGSAFYIIPIPFVIDVTIERMFFSVVILVTFVAFVKAMQQRAFFSHSIEMFMALFVVLCLISMLQHGFFPREPGFTSPWFVFITAYLFPFVTFYFAKYYLSRPADIRLIFNVIFYIGAYLSIMALFEYRQIDQLIFPRYVANPDIGIHYGQARGPFLNSPHMGMAVIFGLACGMHLISYKKGLSRLILLGLFFFFPAAAFFTLTRAVYLAFVVLVLIYLVFYRADFPKWKVAALPFALVMILVLAMLPRFAQEDRRAGGLAQPETVTIRKGLAQMSILMLQDQPITGVGLSQFIPATLDEYRGRVPILDIYQDATYFHNHLLGMAVELGLTGVLVYISIIILMFKRLFALSRHLSSSHDFINTNFLVAVSAIWLTFLINFNFSSPEFQIYPNSVIFLLAGVVDGLYQRHRQLEVQPAFHTGQAELQYRESPA